MMMIVLVGILIAGFFSLIRTIHSTSQALSRMFWPSFREIETILNLRSMSKAYHLILIAMASTNSASYLF